MRGNTLSPGSIEPSLWSRMPDSDRTTMFTSAAGRLLKRRVGQFGDIANAILLLATILFATGSTVLVMAVVQSGEDGVNGHILGLTADEYVFRREFGDPNEGGGVEASDHK